MLGEFFLWYLPDCVRVLVFKFSCCNTRLYVDGSHQGELGTATFNIVACLLWPKVSHELHAKALCKQSLLHPYYHRLNKEASDFIRASDSVNVPAFGLEPSCVACVVVVVCVLIEEGAKVYGRKYVGESTEYALSDVLFMQVLAINCSYTVIKHLLILHSHTF